MVINMHSHLRYGFLGLQDIINDGLRFCNADGSLLTSHCACTVHSAGPENNLRRGKSFCNQSNNISIGDSIQLTIHISVDYLEHQDRSFV